jgi:hypothetical protein
MKPTISLNVWDGGEGTVSTFVSEDPRTSHYDAHPEGIERPTCNPQCEIDRCGWDVSRQHLARCVDEGRSHGQVSRDEYHGSEA